MGLKDMLLNALGQGMDATRDIAGRAADATKGIAGVAAEKAKAGGRIAKLSDSMHGVDGRLVVNECDECWIVKHLKEVQAA